MRDGRPPAVATDKRPLLPGRRAGGAENVISYSRGINGVMVDVGALPAGSTPSADDFELHTHDGAGWAPVAVVASVTVRRGAGTLCSDRLTLTLPDSVVRNGWLRVTVKANVDTGLASPDVFYLGNLVGDSGADRARPIVNAADVYRTRARLGSVGDVTEPCDFDRDGMVGAADLLHARLNQGRRLLAISADSVPATPAAPFAPRPPASGSGRDSRRD